MVTEKPFTLKKKHGEMKKLFTLIILTSTVLSITAQQAFDGNNQYQNTATRLINMDRNLTIGGYAQIDYNQPLNIPGSYNGNLDVHRLVLLFGYRFNERTNFVTEIEFEHVSEVYVEQAFLQYKITNPIQFRAGLLLTPMGIINEYHEPTTYNGVERPVIDHVLTPTTWRELGAGFTGNVIEASLRYQAYIMNGFKSYDEGAKLSGKNGFRSGRQKGAESFITYPNFAGKVEYYGIRGLNIGLSGYFGKTSSSLYDEDVLQATKDSSVVGISMVGLDARYIIKGLQLRGQFYYSDIANTKQYNEFTADEGIVNDLGSAMYGYYVEAGYDVFQSMDKISSQLIPFVRYSQYDKHASTMPGLDANSSYKANIITSGIGWKITPGSILKADVQFIKTDDADEYLATFNAGVGIMF